jgi:hypothetical protein
MRGREGLERYHTTKSETCQLPFFENSAAALSLLLRIRNRDLPSKYYELRDRIVDLLYPEFLRKEHKRNPKFRGYVDSLPQ